MHASHPILGPTRRSGKKRVLHGLQRLLFWSGLSGLYVKTGGGRGATILMYHSIVSGSMSNHVDPSNALHVSSFESQMRFLRQRRRVISMNALIDIIERRVTAVPGTVVITFDDGYLDNLRTVAPILDSHGFPATLYLATGHVSRQENQWIDRLYSMFFHRTRNRLDIPETTVGVQDLADPLSLASCYSELSRILLESDWDSRSSILANMENQLAPHEPPPRLTLGWNEVRELTRRYKGWDIGVHTRNHIDLSTCGHTEAWTEIETSIEDYQTNLSSKPIHFSFPYGRSTERLRSALSESSIKSAVASADCSLITPEADPFHLPRLDTSLSPSLFRYVTSGAHPDLTKRLVNRA